MSAISPEEEKRLSYGWFRFRPGWLQFLNTPKWFLFFLSHYYFTRSFLIYGMYPAIASMIQKRFQLPSYRMRMIRSSFDISALIVTPFVSFLGGSRKKPVFCGCGFLALAVGLFILTSVHFVFPSHQSLAGDNSHIYALFILGMVVAGIGVSPLYTLGVPYMDENVNSKVSPMYMGTSWGFAILGATAGFFSGSLFSENWWQGFAIFGSLGAFSSLWLFGFPKEFPLTARKRREKARSTEESSNNNAGYTKLVHLPKATKLVFSRLPFVFVTIVFCIEGFLIACINGLGAKIFEFQYFVPPGQAVLLMGSATTLAAFLGNMIGAYINKRLNLNQTGAAKMCFITAAVSLAVSTHLYMKCDTLRLSVQPNSCKEACTECTTGMTPVSAVCTGVEQSTNISSCYAGCKIINYDKNKNVTLYENCKCVETQGEKTKVACQMNCGFEPWWFLLVLSVVVAVMFLNDTASVIVILRSAPAGLHSYALGLQQDLKRLFGNIPGLFILAALMDKICILHEDTECGKVCLEYDHRKLALLVLGVMMTGNFINTTAFFLAWCFSRGQDKVNKDHDNDDDEGTAQETEF